MADARAPLPPRRGRDWRPPAAAVSAATPAARRRRAFGLIAAVLAVLGAIGGLIWWLAEPPVPYLLTVPIRAYTFEAFPPNATAEADSDALLATLPGPSGRPSEKAFDFQTLVKLRKKLASLRDQHRSPVVVHLSALAASRGDEVCLLPADATPDEPAGWLPVGEILDAIGTCPAREKLLLLDLAHPLADPTLGILADDAAARLQADLEKRSAEGRLPFLVLCSCSARETSWAVAAEGVSAFAYYVREGLRGAARDEAGHVKARGLATFVTTHVARWAERTHDVRQTPALYGPPRLDFELTRPPSPPPGEPPPAPAPYPKALLEGWSLRDQWLKGDAPAVATLEIRRLEALLLRAEQEWQAGGWTERQEKSLADECNPLRRQVEAALADRPPAPRSLAQARSGLPPLAAELREAVRALLARAAALPPPKPEELAKARAEFLARCKDRAVEAAAAIVEETVEDPEPRAEKVRLLAEAVQGLSPPPKFAETLLLQRLANWRPRTWPAAPIGQALRTALVAERALAADPDAFAWLSVDFDDAAQARLKAEERLFASIGPTKAAAAEADLKAAADRFQTLQNHADLTRSAYRFRDEAFMFLAGHAFYLSAVESEPDLKLWEEAARSAGALADLLARPDPKQAFPADELQTRMEALRRPFTQLRRPFMPSEVKKWVNRAGATAAGPADCRQMEELLRSPALDAKSRADLWTATRALAHRLHGDIVAEDRSDRAAPAPPPVSGSIAAAAQGDRNARLADGLLRHLGGLARVEPSRLRDAWHRQLPERARPAATPKDWPAADRARRILLPLEKATDEAARSPARLLRVERRSVYRRWMADAYGRAAVETDQTAPVVAAFYRVAQADWAFAAR